MEQILVFLLVVVAIGLVVLVLLQQGKGADIGASFGSGASNTVFGSQGSGSFLMKLTFGFAVVFFALCIILARMAVAQTKDAQNFSIAPTPVKTQPVQKSSRPTPVPVQSTGSNSKETSVPVVPSK